MTTQSFTPSSAAAELIASMRLSLTNRSQTVQTTPIQTVEEQLPKVDINKKIESAAMVTRADLTLWMENTDNLTTMEKDCLVEVLPGTYEQYTIAVNDIGQRSFKPVPLNYSDYPYM